MEKYANEKVELERDKQRELREQLQLFKKEIEDVKGIWSYQQVLDCLKRFKL